MPAPVPDILNARFGTVDGKLPEEAEAIARLAQPMGWAHSFGHTRLAPNHWSIPSPKC